MFCEVTSREFVESVSFILDAFPYLFFDRDVVNCGYGRILMEPLSAEKLLGPKHHRSVMDCWLKMQSVKS